MIGLGSAGLYASFGGGYVFKHLYDLNVLVALFVILSGINLAFGYWKCSKSFVAVGLLGGLSAAAMPMRTENVALDYALHFLVLLSCVGIISHRRWFGIAVLLWIVSHVALIPASISTFDHTWRVGAVYLNAALTLYACGKSFKPSEGDRFGASLTILIFLSGLASIGMDGGHRGSVFATALAIAGTFVGWMMGGEKVSKQAIWLGSLLVLSVITPIGFDQRNAALIYAAESIVLSAIAIRLENNRVGWVGFTALCLSIVSYQVSGVSLTIEVAVMSTQVESLLLGLISTSIILSIWLAARKGSTDFSDGAYLFGSAALVACFVRATNILLPPSALALSGNDASFFGLSIASIILVGFAIRLKRIGLYVSAALAGCTTAVLAFLREPNAGLQWLTALGLLSTAVSVVLISQSMLQNRKWEFNAQTHVAAGVALSAVFIRMIQIAGSHSAQTFDQNTIVYLGFGILNVVWTALCIWKRSTHNLTMAWLSLLFAAGSGVGIEALPTALWFRPALLLTALLTLSTLYWITRSSSTVEKWVSGALVAGSWLLTTFLMRDLLTRPSVGMKDASAITVSWVVVAITLIVIGFALDRRYLRYGSLGIFTATVIKVFLVDLSTLDSVVRVAILMLLGFGMVGVGYWYIVWSKKNAVSKRNAIESEQ